MGGGAYGSHLLLPTSAGEEFGGVDLGSALITTPGADPSRSQAADHNALGGADPGAAMSMAHRMDKVDAPTPVRKDLGAAVVAHATSEGSSPSPTLSATAVSDTDEASVFTTPRPSDALKDDLALSTLVRQMEMKNSGSTPTEKTKPIRAAAPIKVLRRSSRIAATADVRTLRKAENLTAKKNLEFSGNSFTSFPDSKVLSNLGRVGINLGSSDVISLKNLEVDRLVLRAKNKKVITKSKVPNSESEDERDNNLEAILSHACGNLSENLPEEENDQIIDLSALRRKKKYNNAKNTFNGKLPKKPKAPSKISIK